MVALWPLLPSLPSGFRTAGGGFLSSSRVSSFVWGFGVALRRPGNPLALAQA